MTRKRHAAALGFALGLSNSSSPNRSFKAGRKTSIGWDLGNFAPAVIGALLLLAVMLPFGIRDEVGTLLAPSTRWWERLRFPQRPKGPDDRISSEKGPSQTERHDLRP